MKAAVVGEKGAEVRDIPKPEPAPNEILIKVRASSLNRADVGVAAGQQHGRVGGIGARLGLECSGEVEVVGREVTTFKPGDRVWVAGRGRAELQLPAGNVVRLGDETRLEIRALPEVLVPVPVGDGARRLCRICDDRRRPRQSHSRQQHDL